MSKIRLAILMAIILWSNVSCKKILQQTQEDYVLSVMTTGRWFLQNYTVDQADNTYDFIAYEFQFYENNKIEAITVATTQAGTWQPDPANRSMTIQFPAGSGALQRLSYTWVVTDVRVGLVFAETTTASGKITIRLKKKI